MDEILTKADRDCNLWALIETPRGVANAMAIGAASDRLTALTFGLVDFAAEMGASLAWEGMLSARVQVVMAAGIAAVDEVFSPTPAALNWARGVVRSFEEADGGIRVVDGSMVGPPFLRKAPAILERSEGR